MKRFVPRFPALSAVRLRAFYGVVVGLFVAALGCSGGSDTPAAGDVQPATDAPGQGDTAPDLTPDAGPDDLPGGNDTAPDTGSRGDVAVPDAGPPADVAPADVAAPPFAACSYTNPFSQGAECKQYTGPAWTEETASANCAAVLPGTAGTFALGERCGFAVELGRCVVTATDGTDYTLVSGGSDEAKCDLTKAGCEVFAKGVFVPGPPCDGSVEPPLPGYGTTPFIQPYLNCRDPLPGEPPGTGENGQVCTWTLISGCTEPGRRYDDYASCADVLTQRPYYPAPTEPQTAPEDPRLSDPVYQAELRWVAEQVEACACVCCHSTRAAPRGPSMWYVEADPLWIDSVADSGLSMLAGLSDSTALGAYPAAENHGFDRTALGLPTNDIPRMRAFLEAEWARRGFTPEQGAAYAPFGGPIYDQLIYEPEPCAAGIGVASDGLITWRNGPARYIYVLAEGSRNPGVPPNLDLPEGTLWLVDVPHTSDAVSPGLTYGDVTGDLRQRVPAAGAPPALEDGTTYLLYVLRDIGFPIARCLFTYPAE